MRIFATAQECCAELIGAGWTICIASSEPDQAGSLLLSKKVAIVAAEPFPSKAFLQAASHEAPGKVAQLSWPASTSTNHDQALSNEYMPSATYSCCTLHTT